LGIEDEDGKPTSPPKGLSGFDLEDLQRKIRVACKKIEPKYQPIITPEIYTDREIIILWAPAGDNRTYDRTCSVFTLTFGFSGRRRNHALWGAFYNAFPRAAVQYRFCHNVFKKTKRKNAMAKPIKGMPILR
jgi:hypothetical protein